MRLFIIIIITILIISIPIYFKLNLYFTDRYDWYIYLGSKYLNIGMNKKAFEYANKALNLDKDRPKAYKLRVIIFTAWEEYYLAEKELETLKDKDKKYYYWHMGHIKLKQGMLNQSMKYFRKGIEEQGSKKNTFISPNYMGVGIIYLKNNDLENAFKYFNQSTLYLNQSFDKEWTSGIVHAGLGFVYQKKGLYQKAEEEFRIAKSIHPNAMNNFFNLIS